MANPKAGPPIAQEESDLKLEGRLLNWNRDDSGTYMAASSRAIGIVFRYRRGYHWEIFFEGEVKYSGQVRSLHSALCRVEGNFVGRGMLDTEENESAREEETMGGASVD